MAEPKVKLNDDEIPTRDTLLTLGSGSNAIQISPLGFGCWQFGDKDKWGYQGYDRDLNENSMQEAFSSSSSLGVNFFDTAEVYGKGESEAFLGKFIKQMDGTTKVVVATKFFPMPYYLFYPNVLLNHLKESLKRLQLQQVDLYQIHAPIHWRTVEVLADALAVAVEQGLVKTVGVSNYSLSEVQRAHAVLKSRGIQLASNQVEFSLLRLRPLSSGLIEECHKLGIAVLAYSPLAMGRLTGKYSKEHQPVNNSSRQYGNVSWDLIDPIVEKLNELGAKYNKTPAQIALNWIICKGAIPIPGAKNGKQAHDNAGALGFRLSQEEVTALQKLGHPGTNRFWQHG